VTDAEDVLQLAFTEVFRKLDTFRFESSIGAWVKRIVLNHCINFLKSKRVEFEAFDDRLHDRPDDYQHQHDASDDIRLDVQHIRRGIEKLPDGYRVVLSLYLLEGYDHEEIGQILKISEQTSKSQFHRAKSRLREMLAADYSA
jgi:RNA polymerase sigma-70 factor (ECF subfamily)